MRSPIALGRTAGRSTPLNAGRLVNLYAEPTPASSVSPWVLYGTPGQKTFATVGTAPIRCGWEALGYAYVLSGSSLYRVNSDGTSVLCTGSSISPSGTAAMIDNGTQLGLLVNGTMFYAVGTVVTQVSDGDFPAIGASSLDYIDGYAAFSTADTTGQWFISSLHDFSAYDALDFASAESSPDGLLKVLAHHKEMWLFGTKTTEVWSDTGGSPFPFEQIPGSLMNRGIGAPQTAKLLDNAPFWLGDDRIFYRASGYTPMRISSFPIEEIIRTGYIADAYSMTYSQGGHQFYATTFPSLGRTLVFDVALASNPDAAWHERQTGTDVTPAAWGALCIFNAFGKILVGNAAGALRELDLDTYTEGSGYMRRAVTSMPIYPAGKRALMREIELECELGVGLNTGQGIDPQAMLRFSKDGGRTFGNVKTAALGPTGAVRARCMWNNLGMFRNGVAEIAISDPIKVAIYGARYEPEGLSF